MKYRTTRKAITAAVQPEALFSCGYADMAYLLHFRSPVAYHCGVYGWNFDVYEVNGLTITTGYRQTVGKRIKFDLLRSYEQKAKAISLNWEISLAEKEQQTESLLSALCDQLTKGV